MTASANTMIPPATMPISAADCEPPPSSRTAPSNHHLLFKKHKVLPHPRKDAPYATLRLSQPPRIPRNRDLVLSKLTTSYQAASSDDASTTNSQPSSPRTMKHYPKKLGTGPDLPPTPPAHSRNSSSTYSVLPSSATYVQSPERSSEDVQMKPPLPTTPTKQMSPPTPDVTPPHAIHLESRTKGPALRPPLRDRNPSKATTDSRTESFKTARENPSSSSSDDEDGHSTLRPVLPSARTSESTVRRVPTGDDDLSRQRQHRPVGLGLGLESSPEESITPKSKSEFVSFDGEWGSGKEEVTEEWDENLGRNVVVRSHRIPHRNASAPYAQNEVVEDAMVTPTNATKALRAMSLPQRILTFPSPSENAEKSKQQTQLQQQPQQPQQQQQPLQKKQPLASAAPIIAQMIPASNSSASDMSHRVSTTSSKSTISTVVEAVLLGTPPQRRRTLRHVKKQVALRDSGLDLSPTSSAPTSLLLEETSRQRRLDGGRFNGSGHDSVVSTTTINSISSRSARREVWKAGGIPVVVVPGRLSSAKSASREPSLRSTSSRKSRRSQSLHSVPLSQFSKSGDFSPHPEPRSRRSRTYSESDGSAPGDQRTIDYPPVIPTRTSSLSAPTSRNASRRGSMTAESIQSHAALLKSRLKEQEKDQRSTLPANAEVETKEREREQKPTQPIEMAETDRKAEEKQSPEIPSDVLYPEVRVERAPSTEPTILPRTEEMFPEPAHGHTDYSSHDNPGQFDPRSNFDRHGDLSLSKQLSPHNTPFSMVSVETTTTHHSQAEVSEALAVNIYPHQNTSVLVVDHSNRPSDCSDDSQPDRLTDFTESNVSKEGTSPASEFASGDAPSSASAPPLKPTITTSIHDTAEKAPVTPSHPQFKMDDVDSPLRNPRAPPEPPAINFIPATPSGLTPSAEKERNQGNYFEEIGEDRPRRRRSVSLVLRSALGRGRNTEYGPSASRSAGLLTRTLSLTRAVPRRALSFRRSDSIDRGKGLAFDFEPAEGDKLHPFWRPASSHRPEDVFPGDDIDDDDAETYRYPPIDNRPRGPRRSFSTRMKRTFAILPLNDSEDFYPATSNDGPDRRTVRRTPSGNLRVVKHRGSIESLGQDTVQDHRPYTAPERQGHRFLFWRSPSFSKAAENLPGNDAAAGNKERKMINILPHIGDKIGEYGPHTISRRFSERRREKRSNELRQMISGPQEVRDGVGDVIRRTNYRDAFTQAQVG